MPHLKIIVVLVTCILIACNQDKSALEKGDVAYDSVKQLVNEKLTISDASSITCPFCQYKIVEKLPTEYCRISYDCKKCKKTIVPKDGDCCVFCSYGTHKCPSMQTP